jgi:diacylglycerol kinase (ATP)
MDSQVETSHRTAAIPPNPAARTVPIFMNPLAGRRARFQHVRAIEQALSSGGYDVQFIDSLDELTASTQLGRADGRLRAVVSAGGDGTASLVRSRVPLEVPLLALPMGTENLLARYVGQSSAPHAVRRTLDEGVTIELDLGRAGDRYFLLMISAGFDAAVIRSLHEDRRGNITRLSYYLPTLRTIRGYAYPEMWLYCSDDVRQNVERDFRDAHCNSEPIPCRWMFGFNLPVYALGIPIAPEAVATDAWLDVVAFQRGGLASVARYLWHVLRGSHARLADATLVRCRRMRLESAGIPDVAYQLDGDFAGTLPVEVEMLPRQLRLFVSREAASRLGFEGSPAGRGRDFSSA